MKEKKKKVAKQRKREGREKRMEAFIRMRFSLRTKNTRDANKKKKKKERPRMNGEGMEGRKE